MAFKDNSAFKSDKFKYENENFTPEELKELEKKNFDGKLAKKFQEQKDREFVEVMEDDETAAAYVEKTEKAKMKKAQDLREEASNYVGSSKYQSYRTNLAEWGMWLLMQKGFPSGYEYHCIPTKDGSLDVYGKNFKTKDGVLFVLKGKNGGVYIKAMEVSGNTEVDVAGVQLMTVEVENTIDALEGKLEDMNSGADSNKIVDDAVSKLLGPDGKPLKWK